MNDLMNKNEKTPAKIQVLHRYYRYTGFYSFVGTSLKKAIVPISAAILGLWLIDKFVFDFSDAMNHVVNNYSPLGILAIFFTSESILGLLPPEIFIYWSLKSANPIALLSLLAILSYLGGVVAYFIGKGILHIPSIHNYLENKIAHHITNVRKWGGFLIIVGALLPLPFAISSLAAGLINYRFKNYLLFGLLRLLRFYIYAYALFNII